MINLINNLVMVELERTTHMDGAASQRQHQRQRRSAQGRRPAVPIIIFVIMAILEIIISALITVILLIV